jgi:hypothetical protein
MGSAEGCAGKEKPPALRAHRRALLLTAFYCDYAAGTLFAW